MSTTDVGFWDAIAEKYAARPVADVPAFERKKEITRGLLPPGAAVLEVGAGTGSLALDMARSAGHIHALDASAEMVRIANQKRAAQGATNVTFAQGTLDGPLPYPPATFDSVWAFSLLHLVADRRRVLAAAFALLKPGGTFVSSNVCLGDSWVPYRPLLALMHRLGKAPAVFLYGRATLTNELGDAGFVDVREHDVGAARTVAFVVARKPLEVQSGGV